MSRSTTIAAARAARTRPRVAFHESGHAVALLVHGLPFQSVTVYRTQQDSAGGLVLASGHPPPPRVQAVIALAGAAAEALWSRRLLMELIDGAVNTVIAAITCQHLFGGPERPNFPNQWTTLWSGDRLAKQT